MSHPCLRALIVATGLLASGAASGVAPAQDQPAAQDEPATQDEPPPQLLRNPGFEEIEGNRLGDADRAAAPADWRLEFDGWRSVVAEDAVDGRRVLASDGARAARLAQVVRWRRGTAGFARLTVHVRGAGAGEVRLVAEDIRGARLHAVSAALEGGVADAWTPLSLLIRTPGETDRLRVDLVAAVGAPIRLDGLRLNPTDPGREPDPAAAILGAAEPWRALTDALGRAAAGPARARMLRLAPWVDRARGGRLLLDAVTDPELSGDRAAALHALPQLGPDWTEELARLVRLTPQSVVRPPGSEVVRALARWQDPALLAALPQLFPEPTQGPDPDTLRALARAYPLADIAPILLEPRLRPSVPEAMQDAILQVLAEARDPRFFDALATLAPAATPERRLRWLQACAAFDGAPALDTLAGFVANAPADERAAFELAFLRACRAMESYAARSWHLQTGLRHRDAFVRQASLRVLGPDLQPIEVSAVLRLTRDPDAEVLTELVRLLRNAPSPATEAALLGLIGHHDAEVAADALRAFWEARGGDARVRGIAERVLDGGRHWTVEQTALELLAERGAGLAPARLEALATEHPDWRVRRTAAALGGQTRASADGSTAAAAAPRPVVVVLAVDPAADARRRARGEAATSAQRRLALLDLLGGKACPESYVLLVAGAPDARFPERGLADPAGAPEAQAWLARTLAGVGDVGPADVGVALRRAVDEGAAGRLWLIADPELPQGDAAAWQELVARYAWWNRHQRLRAERPLGLDDGPDGGRLSEVFTALRTVAPTHAAR